MTNRLHSRPAPAIDATSAATAAAQLRTVPVRVTAARVDVLAVLLAARSAVSHQDIQDQLATLDRVTLYRALDCLTDAGLAHKIAGDDRVFRYSAGSNGDLRHPHGHFKCTRCGHLYCLEPASGGTAGWQQQLHDSLRQTLGAGFQSHDIELTIKGWCAQCASISD